MKKIISLFKRNYDGDRLVRNEVVEGAEWVLAGEGVAMRKMDGTCCMIRAGKLYKRYEVKPGGKPPANFEPANDVDEATGKQQGWVPVGDGPDDRWHREAFAELVERGDTTDGTYELVGPKVQGNPEKYPRHCLVAHTNNLLRLEPYFWSHLNSISESGKQWLVPRDFDGLKAYLADHDIEGIVWHHDDGRMVKIKGKDFGIKRGRL